MNLDVRFPLGWLFLTLGVILILYGATAGGAPQSLGQNLNLVWGIVFAGFGGIVLAIAYRGKR